MMGTVRWVVGGLIGAVAGVAIWTIVGDSGHRQFGWIAWGVGFLCGLGVRYAAYLGGEDASTIKGIYAAVLALAAVFSAKYLVFSLKVADAKRSNTSVEQIVEDLRKPDDAEIARVAGDLAAQAAQRGEDVAWPPGVTAATASKQSDFPPKIWEVAQRRWLDSGTPAERTAKRQRLVASERMLFLVNKPTFGDAFSPFDLLWFGLAVVTAYRIGVGSYGTD